MIDDIARIGASALARISAMASLDELRALEAELLGKTGELTALKKGLGTLDPEERKIAGQAMNEARSTLEALLADRRSVLERAQRAITLTAERLDLTEVTDELERGTVHLVTQT